MENARLIYNIRFAGLEKYKNFTRIGYIRNQHPLNQESKLTSYLGISGILDKTRLIIRK